MKAVRVALAVGAAGALLATAFPADALTARVRCRVKAPRTQISVDGIDLAPGRYTATVNSSTDAAGPVTSKAAINVVAPADEAEFDFYSNPADIAAGATTLPPNFVTLPGNIAWRLLRNGAVVLSGIQACTSK